MRKHISKFWEFINESIKLSDRFNEEQNEKVGFLMHDKEHVLGPTQRKDPILDITQPGESSGKPLSQDEMDFMDCDTDYLTIDEILDGRIQRIPYYREVLEDVMNGDYSWGVTKKVVEYARYMKKNPKSLRNLPPIIVVDDIIQDGAHRISAIYLLQNYMDENNQFWGEIELEVKFCYKYLHENIRRILREETKVKKQPSIKVYNYKKYTLILSKNPCDIFTHFKVKELHGLNYQKCLSFKNTKDNAYIGGLTNLSPKTKKHFLFLNTSRLGKGKERMGLIMHETMHLSLELHQHDVTHKEEDIITWAENEAYKIYDILENKL